MAGYSEQPPVVLYETLNRKFQRVLQETTLQDLHEMLQTKLGLNDGHPLELLQNWDGNDIELSDDADFLAFSARTKREGFARVRVAFNTSEVSSELQGSSLRKGKGKAKLLATTTVEEVSGPTSLTNPSAAATSDHMIKETEQLVVNVGSVNGTTTAANNDDSQIPLPTPLISESTETEKKKRKRKSEQVKSLGERKSRKSSKKGRASEASKAIGSPTDQSPESPEDSGALISSILNPEAQVISQESHEREKKKKSKKRKVDSLADEASASTLKAAESSHKKRKKSRKSDDANASTKALDSEIKTPGSAVPPQTGLGSGLATSSAVEVDSDTHLTSTRAQVLSTDETGNTKESIEPAHPNPSMEARTEQPVHRKATNASRNKASTDVCPVCLGSFHYRVRCPVVEQGPEAIRRRIQELKSSSERPGERRDDLIKDLEMFLHKKTRNASQIMDQPPDDHLKPKKLKRVQKVQNPSSQEKEVSHSEITLPTWTAAEIGRSEDDITNSSSFDQINESQYLITSPPAEEKLLALLHDPKGSKKFLIDDEILLESEGLGSDVALSEYEEEEEDGHNRKKARRKTFHASRSPSISGDEESSGQLSTGPEVDADPDTGVPTEPNNFTSHQFSHSTPFKDAIGRGETASDNREGDDAVSEIMRLDNAMASAPPKIIHLSQFSAEPKTPERQRPIITYSSKRSVQRHNIRQDAFDGPQSPLTKGIKNASGHGDSAQAVNQDSSAEVAEVEDSITSMDTPLPRPTPITEAAPAQSSASQKTEQRKGVLQVDGKSRRVGDKKGLALGPEIDSLPDVTVPPPVKIVSNASINAEQSAVERDLPNNKSPPASRHISVETAVSTHLSRESIFLGQVGKHGLNSLRHPPASQPIYPSLSSINMLPSQTRMRSTSSQPLRLKDHSSDSGDSSDTDENEFEKEEAQVPPNRRAGAAISKGLLKTTKRLFQLVTN